MNKKKYIRFPYLFTLMVFFAMCIGTCAMAIFFSYTQLQSDINDLESQLKTISRTFVSTYTEAAELHFQAKTASQLLSLMQNANNIKGVKEVFFVRDNGTIVAHSDSSKAQQLQWNIANDPIYYNIDLVLYPHSMKSKDLFVFEYYIPDIGLPFNRIARTYIQRFLYKDININSWLVTKAVFSKGVPIGTVNCIVDKTVLYELMMAYYSKVRLICAILGAVSFVFAVAIGTILFIKQRRVVQQAVSYTQEKPSKRHVVIKEAIPLQEE